MFLSINVKQMTLAAATAVLMTATLALAQNAPAPGNTPANTPAPGNAPAEKPAPAPGNAPAANPNAKPSNTTPTTPAPDAKPAEEKLVYVLMKTSKGDITIELNREKAPLSVANFLSYVDRKYYDGLIFHRVMSNFMIQGGGFNKDMVQKATDAPIKNEWQNGLKNLRGTIAMARTNQPDTATSQFFINVVDNAGLDRPQPDGAAYAVFGKVVAGMTAVDAIRGVRIGNRGMHQNVPAEAVTIDSVTRITAEEAAKAAKAESGTPSGTGTPAPPKSSNAPPAPAPEKK